MKDRRALEAVLAGALLGFVLFRNAPGLLGRTPWDGGVVYLALVVAAGGLTALVDRRQVWPGPAGLLAGQVLSLLLDWARGAMPSDAPPLGLQVLFLGAPTLCALCGAAAMTVLAGPAVREER